MSLSYTTEYHKKELGIEGSKPTVDGAKVVWIRLLNNEVLVNKQGGHK